MTTRLAEAIAHVKSLPEDDQDRVADAIIAFANERTGYDLTEAELAGIDHAMRQADAGLFANEAMVRSVLGREL
ncbi:MAG: hypothetical protein AB7F99_00680 [Vicinamibacterales bacterium]